MVNEHPGLQRRERYHLIHFPTLVKSAEGTDFRSLIPLHWAPTGGLFDTIHLEVHDSKAVSTFPRRAEDEGRGGIHVEISHVVQSDDRRRPDARAVLNELRERIREQIFPLFR